MTLVARAALTDQPIRLDEHEDLVGHQAAGAVVGFVGKIRDHDNSRHVVRLEYSAHPSAADVIAAVVAEIAAQSPGVRAVAASHRIGVLQIGEAALVVAVAADHRQAAFATCAQLVDAIKGAVTGMETPSLRRRNRRVGGLGIAAWVHPPANGGSTSSVLPARSCCARSRTAKPSQKYEHRNSTRASS